jgi:hypothetical protein
MQQTKDIRRVTAVTQRRSKDLQVNLEPTVHALVVDLSRRMGTSASNYIRTLIVEDLRNRGVLTDSMLADMAAGITTLVS